MVLVPFDVFLGHGSFFPNCQSEEVVEQLFDSVSVVLFNSSSVVLDVDDSFVDEVVVLEVGSESAHLDEVDSELNPRRVFLSGRPSGA